MKSRTFLVCFEPMRLLPAKWEAKQHCFFKFDYYEGLAHVAEAMRWREQQLAEYTQRLDRAITELDIEHQVRNIKAIETHTDRLIEEGLSMQFYYVHDDMATAGDFMQKLLPPGEITNLKLAFLHHRGAWYTGVASE